MSNYQSFDYIVIGGGSSGCVLAARLAEADIGTVLLLESGDKGENNPETLSADGFKYAFSNDNVMLDRMSVKQESCASRSLYVGTGRGMGGSGAVNGMVYTRGDKLDYAQWPKGWHWDDVAPAFNAVEQRLRVRHRQATSFTKIALEAAETIGFKQKHGLNDGDLCGFMGYNDMNFEGEYRRSSYVAYVKECTAQGRLTVKTKSMVHRIVFDADNKAEAVEVEMDGLFHTIGINKEVIVCAGALETPKLLMLSGVGEAAQLRNLDIPVVKDIPAIGKNLKDHPNVCIFYRGKQPVDFGYPQMYGFDRYNPQLPLPANQADTCITWLAAPITLKQSMYRMLPALALPGKLFFNARLRNILRALISGAFSIDRLESFVNTLYGVVIILGKPLSVGELRLASNNVRDQALVNPGYYQNSEDMNTMLNAAEAVRKMVTAKGLQEWGNQGLISAMRKNNKKKLEKWIKSATMTTFHFCGTCKMGEDVASPVDVQLKLKGFSNVRVADASVMPEIPVSALNAPSMMIAYRAVEFIIQDTHNYN